MDAGRGAWFRDFRVVLWIVLGHVLGGDADYSRGRKTRIRISRAGLADL